MSAEPVEPGAHGMWPPDERGAGGTYQLAADSDTGPVLERPFGIRLPIRDITP